jgi:hypothetical protein
MIKFWLFSKDIIVWLNSFLLVLIVFLILKNEKPTWQCHSPSDWKCVTFLFNTFVTLQTAFDVQPKYTKRCIAFWAFSLYIVIRTKRYQGGKLIEVYCN